MSNQTLNSINLDALAKLAGEARGVEIVSLQAPAGARGLPAAIPAGIRHGTSPELVGVHSLFEYWREHPARRSGVAKAQTLGAYVALTNRHKTANSAIFADVNWKAPSFTTVVDYHPADHEAAPAFLKHRVHYAFPLADPWCVWVKQDGQAMSQADFAAFLEDHIAELSAPNDHESVELERDFGTKVATPAQLIALSRGLQVRVDSAVKIAVTLQSGEGSLVFEEAHKDGDGRPLKVPGLFVLDIAPFVRGETVRIPVRLRYRVSEGKVRWSFAMHRPDIYVAGRISDDLTEAAEKTGLPTYEAAPEA